MISNNDSAAVGAVPDYENPSAIAVDRNGDLLVADRMIQNDFFGSVIRVESGDGRAHARVRQRRRPTRATTIDLVSPAGIAVAPDDSILVSRDPFTADFVNGVQRIDPATGERSLFSSSFEQVGADTRGPWGLAIDSTPDHPTIGSSPTACRPPGPRGCG